LRFSKWRVSVDVNDPDFAMWIGKGAEWRQGKFFFFHSSLVVGVVFFLLRIVAQKQEGEGGGFSNPAPCEFGFAAQQ
jgi:hypothetical protein